MAECEANGVPGESGATDRGASAGAAGRGGGAGILDGKKLSRQVEAELRNRVAALGGRPPGLAVVLVGEDPASQVYVANKEKAAARVGFASRLFRLPAETGETEVLALVGRLAADPEVDGILVQLPLPRAIDADRVLASIPPDKDVDGFHVENLGRLALGEERVVACTPKGVIRLLDSQGFAYPGARALVIGRSRIVGKPMSYLLVNRNCTVTVAHSKTRDLAGEVARADLVVAAVGVRGLIRGEWLKPGAWVVDVGMHRDEAGRLSGDVEAEAARARAAWITPVPGGVGPMTIAMLLENTLEARLRAGGG